MLLKAIKNGNLRIVLVEFIIRSTYLNYLLAKY